MLLLIQILLKAISLYSWVLVVYAFMSWLPGSYESPVGRFILSLVEPVLKPFRGLKLQFFGLDFTILIVLFLLRLLSDLLATVAVNLL